MGAAFCTETYTHCTARASAVLSPPWGALPGDRRGTQRSDGKCKPDVAGTNPLRTSAAVGTGRTGSIERQGQQGRTPGPAGPATSWRTHSVPPPPAFRFCSFPCSYLKRKRLKRRSSAEPHRAAPSRSPVLHLSILRTSRGWAGMAAIRWKARLDGAGQARAGQGWTGRLLSRPRQIPMCQLTFFHGQAGLCWASGPAGL